MLTVLSLLTFAQITPPASSAFVNPPQHREILQPQEVRPLPGELDAVPVFNSNSPELIQTEGILLSTFPPEGMQTPTAHLNYPLEGRFDLFAHHIARGLTPDDARTLYFGVLVYNPDSRPVTLDLLQAVSYLSQEAPFHNLPAYVANPLGTAYSGPGSRTMNDILRGQRQPQWPAQVVIPPRSSRLLMNMPIPLRRLTVPTDGSLPPGSLLLPNPPQPEPTELTASSNPGLVLAAPLPDAVRSLPSNGRSALLRLMSSGPVYVASLAMYAPTTAEGNERVPTLSEWRSLLTSGGFAGPRDHPPTAPENKAVEPFYYGRVAGIAQGSNWIARLTDSPEADVLAIPAPGESISYALSTVDRSTLGTGQVQSAPMLTRYADTAYRAHGNYGIHYDLTLPLYNSARRSRTVALLFQTPLQEEDEGALWFSNPPYGQIFFRGTLRIRYTDDLGIPTTRYLHLVQRRGQAGQPLIRLNMPPGDRRLVQVDFLYPPDATPPQVLTIQTLDP